MWILALVALLAGIAAVVVAFLPGLFWAAWALGASGFGMGLGAYFGLKGQGAPTRLAVAAVVAGAIGFTGGWIQLFS
jgi:hypothetical protein